MTVYFVDCSLFQRLFGFLANWSFLWYHIPASKLSSLHGLTMTFILGLIVVVQEGFPSLTRSFVYLFLVQFVFAIPMAVRDYRIMRAKRDHKHANDRTRR
jgi:uncharacterized membrane protein